MIKDYEKVSESSSRRYRSVRGAICQTKHKCLYINILPHMQARVSSITCKRGSPYRAKIIIALGPANRSLRKHLTSLHDSVLHLDFGHTLVCQPTALQTGLSISSIYTHSISSHRHDTSSKNLQLPISRSSGAKTKNAAHLPNSFPLLLLFRSSECLHTPRTHLRASTHRTKSSSLTARSHTSFYRGRIAWLRCLLPLEDGKG